MDLNFNFLNILVLFGATQGFILCIYIYQKRHFNRSAVKMFIWFLFSLSFLNMMYAFLDLDLFKYYRPLHMLPFPYKWLIGPAFYLYIKNQFIDRERMVFHKLEWLLFLPAIIYFILKLYWFAIAVDENSYRIARVLVDSNFFRIQEVFILSYNLILGLAAFKFIRRERPRSNKDSKNLKSVNWLKNFVLLFIIMYAINLATFSVDLIIHDGKESWMFTYPGLIINVAYIYWIGYLGFSKPKLLFNKFWRNKSIDLKIISNDIVHKIHKVIDQEKIYRNSNLTINQLALQIEVAPKALSNYINETLKMNFSEFLNFHRIEYVKTLLTSEEANKYTLVSLSEEAGFSSKSSFNATFKRMVGMTPSDYKKQFSVK